MPAKNPRLTITLAPTLGAQLRRLSELTGNSQSALIADLLEGSSPVFERLIKTLEAAELAKDKIKGKAADDMRVAQAKLEGQMGLMLESFDEATLPLLAEAEEIKRRSRKTPRGGLARDARLSGSPGASSPRKTPPSNRGVRSLTSPTPRGNRGTN